MGGAFDKEQKRGAFPVKKEGIGENSGEIATVAQVLEVPNAKRNGESREGRNANCSKDPGILQKAGEKGLWMMGKERNEDGFSISAQASRKEKRRTAWAKEEEGRHVCGGSRLGGTSSRVKGDPEVPGQGEKKRLGFKG